MSPFVHVIALWMIQNVNWLFIVRWWYHRPRGVDVDLLSITHWSDWNQTHLIWFVTLDHIFVLFGRDALTNINIWRRKLERILRKSWCASCVSWSCHDYESQWDRTNPCYPRADCRVRIQPIPASVHCTKIASSGRWKEGRELKKRAPSISV